MMKLSMIPALFLMVVAACSSSDGEVALDAATTPLTDQGNDTLFTVRIVDARADGYALDAISVKLIRANKDPLTLACTAADQNANQKIDAGDSLACAEGATNELGADLGGEELDVEVYAKIDGTDTLVGKASWTVAK